MTANALDIRPLIRQIESFRTVSTVAHRSVNVNVAAGSIRFECARPGTVTLFVGTHVAYTLFERVR